MRNEEGGIGSAFFVYTDNIGIFANSQAGIYLLA